MKEKICGTGQEGRQYLITKFVYFEILDNILGNRPATPPKMIITVALEIASCDDLQCSMST